MELSANVSYLTWFFHQGAGTDEWSIDDVIVGEFMMADEIDLVHVTAIAPLQASKNVRESKQLRGTGTQVRWFLCLLRVTTFEQISPKVL